jgi:hypothetical protein
VQEIHQGQPAEHTAIYCFGVAGMLRGDDEIRCGGFTTSTSEHAIDFLFVSAQSTTDLSSLTGNSVRSDGCETASFDVFPIAPGKAHLTATWCSSRSTIKRAGGITSATPSDVTVCAWHRRDHSAMPHAGRACSSKLRDRRENDEARRSSTHNKVHYHRESNSGDDGPESKGK